MAKTISYVLVMSFVGLIARSVAVKYQVQWAADATALANAPTAGRDHMGRCSKTPNVATPHPLTIAETLSLRKPSNVQISPDGTQVAYVVTQAVRDRNEYHAVLYVMSSTTQGASRALTEGNQINEVRWAPDGGSILYVSKTQSGSQVWRIRLDGSAAEQLTNIRGQLAQFWESIFPEKSNPYQMSSDGTRIVYATYDTVALERERLAQAQGGFIYVGDRVPSLAEPKYEPAPFELWSYDLRAREAHKVWTTVTLSKGVRDPEFVLSRDGKTAALLYPTSGGRYTLALLDLPTGRVTPHLTNLGSSGSLRWGDEERSLTFVSAGLIDPGKPHYQYAYYEFEIAGGSLTKLSGDLEKRLDQNSQDGESVARAVEKQSRDFVSYCSLDARKKRAACIRQAPSLPPEVVSIELSNGKLLDRPRVLTHLNAEYDSIQLGEIDEIAWPNNEGTETAGIILPVGYVSGRRYPLLVILKSEYSGRDFIADVPLYTSYPAQAFAGSGYVVLMMKIPHSAFTYPPGDFAAARAAEVDRMVADVRSAVNLLVARAIVDSTKMGVMGTSYGAFWTDYIVTHYPGWFQAAASVEGGVHNPGSYQRGLDSWKQQERNFYGGGPYGSYYSRWKAIAPILNMDHLRAPLLMEYSVAYLNGLEQRTAALEQDGQAELVIYADDDHVFLRPVNRYNSMMRHYDWFNFWLQEKEDPDPAKAEQYKRWRELRKLRQQKKNSSAPSPN